MRSLRLSCFFRVVGVDYKGWFTLGDGMRCDPLTLSDLHSRFLMKAEGMRIEPSRMTPERAS